MPDAVIKVKSFESNFGTLNNLTMAQLVSSLQFAFVTIEII
jgi:hypothetical protein